MSKCKKVCAFTVIALLPFCANSASCNEAKPSRRVLLLLDDRIIEQAENAELTLGQISKHPSNPLMVEDQPWEQRFDNLYPNIVFDPQDGTFRSWHGTLVIDHSARGKSPEERKQRYRPPKDRETSLCYAESQDGLHWKKPTLGFIEYEGSKQNNILARGPHGVGVFEDPHDANPDRRFKQFCKRKEMSVAFSSDGLHWSDYVDCPEIGARGDTHNNAFWAPTLGKYVGITREVNSEFGRLVARTESEDFIHWTPAEVVLHGSDRNVQTYAMTTFYYGDVYLGLLMIHDQKRDRVWTELAWSPDTKKWHRICPGVPLIPNSSEEGVYDWGCAFAAATPIFFQDEIRVYYGGSDGLHFGWRCGSLNLATLRPDGFAGYTQASKEKPAVVTTVPIDVADRSLALNADIAEGGYVEVAAVDRSEVEIARCRFNDSSTHVTIKWDRPIHAKKFRVRLKFSDATVFSLRLQDSLSSAGASP